MKTFTNSILAVAGTALFLALFSFGTYSVSKATDVEIQCKGKGEKCYEVKLNAHTKPQIIYKATNSATTILIRTPKQ